MKKKKINVLSLFDGLGGARLALHQLGIDCNYYRSEIDTHATKVHMANFPDSINLGDVCKIVAKDLPQIDLLIGGSPCQNLSIAGNRKGLKGDQSKLFYEFVRLKDELKPKYFFLENVASMGKEDCKIITKIMGVQPFRINSALVSAQNRRRWYWTNINHGFVLPKDRGIVLKDIIEGGEAIKTGKGKPIRKGIDKSSCLDTAYGEKIPEPGVNLTFANQEYTYVQEFNNLFLSEKVVSRLDVTNIKKCGKVGYKHKGEEVEKSPPITAIHYKGMQSQAYPVIKDKKIRNTKQLEIGGEKANVRGDSMIKYHKYTTRKQDRVYKIDGKSPALDCDSRKLIKVDEDLYLKQKEIERGVLKSSSKIHKGTRMGQIPFPNNPDKKAKCLISLNIKGGRDQNHIGDEYGIRKLTVNECAKLQTIPDWFSFDAVSKTQAYKMIGNGFTIDVIAHFLKFMELR